MTWRRLDTSRYAGPLVRVLVRVLHPAVRPHAEGGRGPASLGCWALLDTGASHSVVDVERVAGCLGLRRVDRRRTMVAEQGMIELPVHEVGVSFPDFALGERMARVSASRLPPSFGMLVGMDLIDGTRIELDIRGDERWLRWRSVR